MRDVKLKSVRLSAVRLGAVALPRVALRTERPGVAWPVLCQRSHLLAAEKCHLLIGAHGGRLLI